MVKQHYTVVSVNNLVYMQYANLLKKEEGRRRKNDYCYDVMRVSDVPSIATEVSSSTKKASSSSFAAVSESSCAEALQDLVNTPGATPRASRQWMALARHRR